MCPGESWGMYCSAGRLLRREGQRIVPLCKDATTAVEPTKGKACLCQKRWLGFENWTVNPTGVWAQTALQDGDKAAAGQKDRYLKSHQVCKCLVLTKSKRDWFWIQLAWSFTGRWKWGAEALERAPGNGATTGNQSWPLWLGNTGRQLPLPENPRKGAKLHLHRPQGSEELQTEIISMCRAVLVCMLWLNLNCRVGAGPTFTQMRRPRGAHHSSLPAHMHRFPSKDALEEANVYPGPCLTCNSDSQLQVN